MSNIKLFESKKIRATWLEAELKWYFSVADVVEALTDTVDVKDYIKKLRKRDPALNANWGTICPLVEMTAADGKRRKIQAANTEGLLRIVQIEKRMRGIAVRDELTSEWQKRGVKESREFAIGKEVRQKSHPPTEFQRIAGKRNAKIECRPKGIIIDGNLLFSKNCHNFLMTHIN